MRARGKTIFILTVAVAVAIATPAGSRQGRAETAKQKQQIVVRVHRTQNGLEYEMRSYNLKKGDANYWLAEIKLRECSDCQVIPIIDDDAPLAAVTQISAMAINAGFTDIRPFVYWRETGDMAEIQFGPPIKFTASTEKIEQRLKRAK